MAWKVQVSTTSQPASRKEVHPRHQVGSVEHQPSIQPSRPPKSSAVSSSACRLVPMAPSTTSTRERSASRKGSCQCGGRSWVHGSPGPSILPGAPAAAAQSLAPANRWMCIGPSPPGREKVSRALWLARAAAVAVTLFTSTLPRGPAAVPHPGHAVPRRATGGRDRAPTTPPPVASLHTPLPAATPPPLSALPSVDPAQIAGHAAPSTHSGGSGKAGSSGSNGASRSQRPGHAPAPRAAAADRVGVSSGSPRPGPRCPRRRRRGGRRGPGRPPRSTRAFPPPRWWRPPGPRRRSRPPPPPGSGRNGRRARRAGRDRGGCAAR